MAMRKCTGMIASLTSVLALCASEPAVWAQGGQASSQSPSRGCNLPEPFPCPVARILELTVEPSSHQP